MQTETNEIRALHNEEDLRKALSEGFEKLPDSLQGAATRKLNGRDSAFVSKTSGGKLSKFAAARRKAKREKARKAANRSRSMGAKRK